MSLSWLARFIPGNGLENDRHVRDPPVEQKAPLLRPDLITCDRRSRAMPRERASSRAFSCSARATFSFIETLTTQGALPDRRTAAQLQLFIP